MILAKQIEFQTSFPIHTRFDFHAYQIPNFSIFYHTGLKIFMKLFLNLEIQKWMYHTEFVIGSLGYLWVSHLL